MRSRLPPSSDSGSKITSTRSIAPGTGWLRSKIAGAYVPTRKRHVPGRARASTLSELGTRAHAVPG